MNVKEIIEELNKHVDTKNHKAASEVFKVLNERQYDTLSEIAETDWFKHYFYQLENLVYSDEKLWNTSGFEKLYNTIVPMIIMNLERINE
ncbi:MAG: hypothetical protein H6587_03470 [Flavobacteriales bacterium]|nr:hypothetical protein [Flavobacteriales bacterium]MCB9363608.1 hypothetical protein [Flavobacteriales bacterium]